MRGGDTKGNLFGECSVLSEHPFWQNSFPQRQNSAVFPETVSSQSCLRFYGGFGNCAYLTLHNMGDAKCGLSVFMVYWLQIDILETRALLSLNRLEPPFLQTSSWPCEQYLTTVIPVRKQLPLLFLLVKDSCQKDDIGQALAIRSLYLPTNRLKPMQFLWSVLLPRNRSRYQLSHYQSNVYRTNAIQGCSPSSKCKKNIILC